MKALQSTEEVSINISLDSQIDFIEEVEEEILEAPFGVVSAIYAQFRYMDRIDPDIILLVKNKFRN